MFCVIQGGNTQDTIKFAGSFIYENSNLAQIQTEEGRVTVAGITYDYEYFLKDHLGNVRATFQEDTSTVGEAELIQENHYYPFGMRISGIVSWTGSNNKLFNDKDLNQEALDGVDLSWYDYGARNYDPKLGMWFNPDPLMEYYSSSSPYNYCLNDPVNNIDPNGMYVAPNYSLWDGRGEPTGGGENRGGGGCRGWSYNGGRDNDARDRESGRRNNDDGSDYSIDIWGYVDAIWADTYAEINRINNSNNPNSSVFSQALTGNISGIAEGHYTSDGSYYALNDWGGDGNGNGYVNFANGTMLFGSGNYTTGSQGTNRMFASISGGGGVFGPDLGNVIGWVNPVLFSPVRLDQNVYQNVLKGFKYLWHFGQGTLPDFEMERWSGKSLKMSDIFDFSTAENWNKGGFMGGSDVIWGNIGGVEVMLQNTTLKGELELDPVHFDMLRIFQAEPYVNQRRIGYMKYYKRHNNYYNNALKYIYSPW